MSSDEEALDLSRQLNLVEAMLNADNRDPRATRLGNRVTAVNANGDSVSLAIEAGSLVLSVRRRGLSRNVTDRSVAEIVDLIERHITGEATE